MLPSGVELSGYTVDLLRTGLPHPETLSFKSCSLIFKLIPTWMWWSIHPEVSQVLSELPARSLRGSSASGEILLFQLGPWKTCVSPQPEHFNRCDCLCGLFCTVWRGKSNNSPHWLSWRSLLAALQRWCHRRPINTESCVTCWFHRAEVTHDGVWKTNQSASWDPDFRDSFTYFMWESKLNLCPKFYSLCMKVCRSVLHK